MHGGAREWAQPIARYRMQSTTSPRRLQRTVRSQFDVTRNRWAAGSKPLPRVVWRGAWSRTVESQIPATRRRPVQTSETEIPGGVQTTSATAVTASKIIGG